MTSWGNIGYIRLQDPRVGFLDVSIVSSIFAGQKQWGVQISFSNGMGFIWASDAQKLSWSPLQGCNQQDRSGVSLVIVVRILVGISPLDMLHQFSAKLNIIFLLR